MTVDDHSAVLIIRVWFEDGPDSFRSRLTTIDPEDGGAEDRSSVLASSPGDVVDAVREWLGRLELGREPPH